jgi:hypothetical protein
MRSDLRITRLSDGQGPAVHFYYDVPLESPDGRRILYSRFDDDTLPSPATVVVADADGSDPTPIGRGEEAIGHVGCQPQWVGADRIAWSPRQQTDPHSVVVDLAGGHTERLPSILRSWNQDVGVGALLGGGGAAEVKDDLSRLQTLRRWDAATGRRQEWLTVQAAHRVHPQQDRFDWKMSNFQNAKFSPDGRHLMVVYGTEVHRRRTGDTGCPRIKSLLVLPVDGGPQPPTYLGEFGHHPMWAPHGNGVIAYVRDSAGQHVLRYPLDGGEPQVLLPHAPGTHCSLDRSAKRLLTDVMGDGRARILLIDLGSGAHQLLADGVHERSGHLHGSHPHPQFSRDGRRVMFNMADSGVPQLYAVDLP